MVASQAMPECKHVHVAVLRVFQGSIDAILAKEENVWIFWMDWCRDCKTEVMQRAKYADLPKRMIAFMRERVQGA